MGLSEPGVALQQLKSTPCSREGSCIRPVKGEKGYTAGGAAGQCRRQCREEPPGASVTSDCLSACSSLPQGKGGTSETRCPDITGSWAVPTALRHGNVRGPTGALPTREGLAQCHCRVRSGEGWLKCPCSQFVQRCGYKAQKL